MIDEGAGEAATDEAPEKYPAEEDDDVALLMLLLPWDVAECCWRGRAGSAREVVDD
jgi:hypothetical protein